MTGPSTPADALHAAALAQQRAKEVMRAAAQKLADDRNSVAQEAGTPVSAPETLT
jgi:hypothetical protein